MANKICFWKRVCRYLHIPILSEPWAEWEDVQITRGGHGGTRVNSHFSRSEVLILGTHLSMLSVTGSQKSALAEVELGAFLPKLC